MKTYKTDYLVHIKIEGRHFNDYKIKTLNELYYLTKTKRHKQYF